VAEALRDLGASSRHPPKLRLTRAGSGTWTAIAAGVRPTAVRSGPQPAIVAASARVAENPRWRRSRRRPPCARADLQEPEPQGAVGAPACLPQRRDAGPMFGTAVAAGEKRVLARQDPRLDRALDRMRVAFDSSVREEGRDTAPVLERVADGVRRTARRASGVRPRISASIAERGSMRRSISWAIGAGPCAAISKNFQRTCTQHSASRTGRFSAIRA
jgi:hypothetical protein